MWPDYMSHPGSWTSTFTCTPDRTAYTGPSSVRPDDHSFRSGVTTVVDAGSSGWRNFDDFKKLIIDQARTGVLALLNIVGAGMAGAPEQNLKDMTRPKPPRWRGNIRTSSLGSKRRTMPGRNGLRWRTR